MKMKINEHVQVVVGGRGFERKGERRGSKNQGLRVCESLVVGVSSERSSHAIVIGKR